MDESTKDLDWLVKFPSFKTLWKPEGKFDSFIVRLINRNLGSTHANYNCRSYDYVTLGGVRRGKEGGKYSNSSFFSTKENPPRIGQFQRFWELVDIPAYVALVKFFNYETDPINRLPTIDLHKKACHYEVITFDKVGEVVVAAPPLQKDNGRYHTILGNVFYN